MNDWDLAEKLWSYAFQRLETEPEDKKVFLTEPPHNPKENKEKMAEIFFENFMVENLHIGFSFFLFLF